MARTSYRLHLRDPHTHLLEIEARFGDLGGAARGPGGSCDLHMAAWTPGSYLVRDYARHVQDVTASDETGRALVVTKQAKATWRVATTGARDLIVRYRVYAYELTVRTSHVDDTHAFVNGAPTWLWLAERAGEPCELEIDVPPGWRIATGLGAIEPGRYLAAHLDELIDSPIHAGPGPLVDFQAADKPAQLALWGKIDGSGVADLETLVKDTAAIVGEQAKLFGGGVPVVPYERYAFMLMLAPGAYGGLEHRASTALLSSPYAFATRKKYEELLELISHEYFHLWNVKRIRPRALGPFDYQRENYTRALWIMEGVTSYYDRLMVRRAGRMPARRYLTRVAEEWGKLVAIPGRYKQSIEESSFDAWIKLYRPDENSVNSTVSYYLKGGFVAMCLDLAIRRRSGGQKSLDDVMRALWQDYGQRDLGFDEHEAQGLFERAAGVALGDLFERTVRGREDPDLAAALSGLGLELKASYEKAPPEGMGEGPPPTLGITTRSEGGRAVVAATLTGSPAEAAGLYAGDEIVAFCGFKVTEATLADRLGARRPGDRVSLVVFRRDELREVEVTLGAANKDKFEIVPRAGASDEERAACRAWIGDDLAGEKPGQAG